MQELLLKDLPDHSQDRRYSRRPSLNEATTTNGSCSGKGVNMVWSKVGCCPSKDGPGASPKVVVEGLSAAWGEASIL